MGRVYFQSIRLAIALVCIGASLILASHWFGLMPDLAKIESGSRRRLSEAVAINTAAHVRKQQWIDLRATIATLIDRDNDLLSVGVRSIRGDLKVDAGHHDEIWQSLTTDANGIDAISVPITLNRRHWGEVEFCFRAPDRTFMGAIAEHPLVRLLAFFCIAGTIAYTLFVGKVMRVFSTTQVVPDRVRQALDTLAEGLLVLDEKAQIVLANRAFAQTVDVPRELLVETGANDLPWTQENDLPCEYFPWMTAIDESATVTEQMLHLRVADGQRRIFSVNAAPIGGGGGSRRGALATFRDVTHIELHRAELETMLSLLRDSQDEIEQKNKKLEILATQDALTGCLNRRAFFEMFGRLWKQAQQTQKPLSCVMIDNDHFKAVNDTYGHGVGDDVLREVSRLLRETFSGHGLVCRYGGEEFCVLLPGMDFADALEMAEQTRIGIEQIRFAEPAELKLTASLGVTETRFNANEPQELINQADLCLYAAKRTGRNCVVPYSENFTQMEAEAAAVEDVSLPEIPRQAVTALVASLAYRDANTAEHCRRVADLCARVSKQYMDANDQYILRNAALLHDIGKVGVADEILLKRGKLSPDEREQMELHDRIGVEVLDSAFECQELTLIVKQRHAFFDGSGRDRNLPSGQEIPIGARLLSICDSYDSMVSDQVYRAGCTHDVAVDELRRFAGTQFDPELVEHFASVVTHKPEPQISQPLSEATLQIQFQVERLVDAINEQDIDGVRHLAARLGRHAHHCQIETIAEAADRISGQATELEIPWLDLLRETEQLLAICHQVHAVTETEVLHPVGQSAANDDDPLGGHFDGD
ncbi:diguanylate cyclase [Stieleria sp. TO1_6]|uniref:diguanylate cyclase n=1 Tax=Stieleria tagensis TaxID=2956795 RepID=UPI00209B3D68|nr:diguanylate cyclase [Stieleria tagensis]MCO8122211.1 diguanylate cyclase [Stieleria tagensis]